MTYVGTHGVVSINASDSHCLVHHERLGIAISATGLQILGVNLRDDQQCCHYVKFTYLKPINTMRMYATFIGSHQKLIEGKKIKDKNEHTSAPNSACFCEAPDATNARVQNARSSSPETRTKSDSVDIIYSTTPPKDKLKREFRVEFMPRMSPRCDGQTHIHAHRHKLFSDKGCRQQLTCAKQRT